MGPDNPHNRDLSARLADLIAANNIAAAARRRLISVLAADRVRAGAQGQ